VINLRIGIKTPAPIRKPKFKPSGLPDGGFMREVYLDKKKDHRKSVVF